MVEGLDCHAVPGSQRQTLRPLVWQPFHRKFALPGQRLLCLEVSRDLSQRIVTWLGLPLQQGHWSALVVKPLTEAAELHHLLLPQQLPQLLIQRGDVFSVI